MVAIVLQDSIRIPRITNLESFRRWARTDQYPEHGWYSYLQGELWADPSKERLIHNAIRVHITSLLASLRGTCPGYVLGRFWFTSSSVDLSTEPDALYISFNSIKKGLVTLAEGLDSVEVEGSPDMTLEVVSPTSVHKDTEVLRDLYWRAGVREYWLVNPLGEEVRFDMLRHGRRGFVATRKQSGWMRSSVFGKSFRLVEGVDPLGERDFTLKVR